MKLLMKTCPDCSKAFQPPVFCCSKCGSSSLTDTEIDAAGEIHTFTVVNATFGRWGKKTPHVLAIVELDGKLRVTTVVECPDMGKVAIGDKVVFSHYDEEKAPIFKTA